MKKLMLIEVAIMAMLLASLSYFGCHKDANENPSISSTELDDRGNPNSDVFSISTRPFGKTYAMWAQAWSQYVLRFPCQGNPLMDATGKYATNEQSGPVFYLVGTTDGPVSRTVTIPTGKGIFFPIINYFNDYPCPDTNFKPEPGQSMQSFLKAGAKGTIDMVGTLEVTLDGQKLSNLKNYRVATDLFSFVGNPDLSTCIDACITGVKQDAVSDGYWIMLKPLSKGKHTLHFHGEISAYGIKQDVNYSIFIL